MPCPHYKIKIAARSGGACSVAGAAYQSGEKLYDERTNEIKDYPEKTGIVYTEILLPENAPPEYSDRNTLWNAVEKSENNWNAQLARRIEIALPIELPMETNIRMLREHVQEQFVSKGMIADIAIHDPEPPGHNPHAHVMLTMRALDKNGKWLPKSRREYELDANGNRIKDKNGKLKFRKVFTTDWDNRDNAEKWRHAWEVTQNKYLEAANRPERISMKSYARQGIEQIPTVHMGPAVTAMERRGIKTNIGNLNREIKKHNALIRSLKKAIGKLKVWIQDVTTAIKEVDLEPKQIILPDLLFARFDERGQDVGVTDFLSFGKVMKYLREHDIKTVPELDERLSFLSVTAQPIKEQISDISGQIKQVEKMVMHLDTKAKLDPVHDKYTKIRWKGRKEKFAAEHHDELTEWKKSASYIDQHMSAGTFTKEELKARISSLKTKLKDLNEQLKPYQAETEIIKYTRTIVKKLIPELTPEGANLTPEIKKEKRSVIERLAAAKQIVKERKKPKQPVKNKGISR